MAVEIKPVKRTKADRNYYLKSAVGIAIMLFFSVLVPPFGPVTELGVKYLGIFLGLIWLWSLVDMGWPVLAAFAAMLILKCDNVMTIIGGFSNYSVMMSLFVMVVVMPIAEASGVFNQIAAWMMNLKFIKGHPWRLTCAVLVLAFVGSVLNAGLVALFMLFDLTLKICDGAQMKRTCMWTGAMFAGISLAQILGTMALPFYAVPLFVLGLFRAAEIAVTINTALYVLSIVAFFVVTLVIYLLLMKFVLRVDVAPLKENDAGQMMSQQQPLSARQKQYTILLLVYLAAMIFVGSISSFPQNAFTGTVANIGMIGVSFIFMIVLLVWRVDGKAAIPVPKMFSSVIWDSILIVWAAMVLAGTLTSEATGISTLMAQLLAPLLMGRSALAFLILVALVTLILTNLFNNSVVLMLVFSFTIATSASLGINIMLIVMILCIVSQMALLLPGSSFNGGLLHGFSKEIGSRNCFLWGAVVMLATALSCIITIPLALGLF